MKTKAEFHARGFADFDGVVRCNNAYAKARYDFYYARMVETQSWQSVAYVEGYRAAMAAFDAQFAPKAEAPAKSESKVLSVQSVKGSRALVMFEGTRPVCSLVPRLFNFKMPEIREFRSIVDGRTIEECAELQTAREQGKKDYALILKRDQYAHSRFGFYVDEQNDKARAYMAGYRDAERAPSEFIGQCNDFAACVATVNTRAAMVSFNRARAVLLRSEERGFIAKRLIQGMRDNVRGYDRTLFSEQCAARASRELADILSKAPEDITDARLAYRHLFSMQRCNWRVAQ